MSPGSRPKEPGRLKASGTPRERRSGGTAMAGIPETEHVGSGQGQRKATVAQSTLPEDVCIEDQKLRRIRADGEARPSGREGRKRVSKMWYAVWVPTGQEEQVKTICDKRLGDQNVYEECFLPKYEKPWRENGAWVKKRMVLFPGYLFFVTEDSERLYRALKSVPKFTKLLGDDEGPIPLYDEETEFLKKHINQDKVFEISVGEYIGKELVITEGPLKDLTGKVVYVDRHGRQAVLEVEFFGRIVKMKVGLEVVGKR